MYTKALALAAVALAPAVAAQYSVNIYWGQKTGASLARVCESDGFEYITLSFLNKSPEQDQSGLGYPGSNFAGNCGASTYGDSYLQDQCTEITSGIAACHAKGKKVLLSIGGQVGEDTNYTVSSPSAGVQFANFLWGAYGPVDASWTGPRPFGNNVVDGFDFDIEVKFPDQSGYIALINQLRSKITSAGGSQVISGAPQCPLNPQFFDMDQMITQAKFDLLFIQFYNNPSCDYVRGNDAPESYNFNAWQSFIQGTASSAAKLFIGLPGDATDQSAGSGYVAPADAYQLMQDAKGQPSFGGAMVWDAYTGGSNVLPNGRNYFENLHDALNNIVVPVPTGTPTPPGCTQVVVKSGEWCDLIARNNGLTLASFLSLNPGLDCNAIQPGDLVTVAGVCPTSTSTSVSSTSTTSSSTSSSSSSSSSIATTSETSTSALTTSATSTSSLTTSETSTSSLTTSETSTSSTQTSSSSSSESSTSTSVSTTAYGNSTTIDPATSTTLTGTAPLGTGSSSTSDIVSAPFGNGTSSSPAPTGTAPLVTGPASTTAGVSAPYGNGTSTYVPSSTGSLVDPTFTSAPYSNGTIPAGSPSSTIAPVVTTPAASLTTSTLTTTTVYTITSCPATVPNCPVGSVTTETITLGVTVCPVVDVTATVVPVTTTPAAGGSGSGSGSGEWTTSTVYTTKVYTITACPPSVPNCPGKGSVTTEIVPAYTTVCPVTATGGSSPSMPAGGAPGGGIKQEASPTTTTRVTSVAYTFITVSSKGPSAGLPAPSGNGSSSVVVSYTVKPTGSGGVAVSSTATGSVPPKPTKPVTAGASRAAGALGLAGLFAAGAMLL